MGGPRTPPAIDSARSPVRAAPGADPGQSRHLRKWEADLDRSDIRFKLRHLVVAEITGHVRLLRASLEIDETDPTRSVLDAVIDSTSVDTGDGERDAHIRSAEFLDAVTFPEIRFRTRKIEPRREGGGAPGYTLTGGLTIHGITRDVTLELEEVLPAEAVGASPDLSRVLRAHGRFNRQEFGLHWNQDLATRGLVVGDNVEVTVQLTVRPPAADAATDGARGEPRAGGGH